MMLLDYIILISLCVTFVHVCFWDGMIFGALQQRFLYKLPLFIRKPLYECIICMAPYYTAIFLECLGDKLTLGEDLVIAFGVGGLNTLINGIIGKALINNEQQNIDGRASK